VLVTSVAAEMGTVDAGYATAKAGLHGFVRALARECGADGVRVNAVVPGPVESPMNDDVLEHLETTRFRGHRTVDTLLDRYEAQPEEVAAAVRFLATQAFVTGEFLHVDGGMSL
jgi:3-oxoacyl-[acyl-carrier protein] reductase